MRASVLLNLLNSLRNNDKMLGKPRILSLFPNLCNELKKEHSCNIIFLEHFMKNKGCYQILIKLTAQHNQYPV